MAPTPTPAPSASVEPNPAAEFKIAAPFTTSPIDPYIETVFKEQYSAGVGAFGSLIEFGGLQVNRDQKLAGYMFAFRLRGVDFTAKEFKQFRDGFTGGTGGFKVVTVNGRNVYLMTHEGTSVALMLLKGTFVMAFAADATTTRGIAKALVTANT